MPQIKDLFYDKHNTRVEFEHGNLTRKQYLQINAEINRLINQLEVSNDCDCAILIQKYIE